MSLVPGLVNKRFAVREEHLNFLHYKSRWSEKSSNETLLGEISVLKLDINDYREQWCYETVVISRSKNSMTAHIINQYPKAI